MLLRFLIVPLSLFISLFIAFFIMTFIGFQRVERLIEAMDDTAEGITLFWNGFTLSSPWLPGVTFAPLFAILMIGEIFHVRSLLYYIVGFGLCLSLFPLMLPYLELEHGPQPLVALWQIFATAGFAAGGVYWVLAGRKA